MRSNAGTKIEYQKDLKRFKKKFVSHFPKSLEYGNYSSRIDDGIDADYPNEMSFVLRLNNEGGEIDSFMKNKLGNIIAEYSPGDDCQLVLNDFYTNSNGVKTFRVKKSTIDTSCKNTFPIPNFIDNDYYTESTKCKLPEDFTVYVIEAKKGVYSNKIIVEKSSMPNEWLHGYSKGVAISEKRNVIMFWMIIW